MFDNDYRQRRHIEELRDQQYDLALQTAFTPSGASQQWVGQIAAEVKELAATVQVLAEKGGLDIAEVERRVSEELTPPTAKARPANQPQGPITEEKCTKCGVGDRSSEMVRVGSAWFCRPCARNP